MGTPTDINQPIIQALYEEALLLADEVRAAFDLHPVRDTGEAADLARLAMSVEGLRTTTRMMHVLAWLLNYRAFFAGDLTEFQLRRHSRLPPDRVPEADNLERLGPQTRARIASSVRLHSRVTRLDQAWRARFEMQPAAIHRLQQRLGHVLR